MSDLLKRIWKNVLKKKRMGGRVARAWKVYNKSRKWAKKKKKNEKSRHIKGE